MRALPFPLLPVSGLVFSDEPVRIGRIFPASRITCCLNSTNRLPRCSMTCTRASCWTRRWLWSRAKWGARRNWVIRAREAAAPRSRAATIGRTAKPRSWPAAAFEAAKSTVPATRSAPIRRIIRSDRSTSSTPSITRWASTTWRPSTTRTARTTCCPSYESYFGTIPYSNSLMGRPSPWIMEIGRPDGWTYCKSCSTPST
jgi:hypothetical protein